MWEKNHIHNNIIIWVAERKTSSHSLTHHWISWACVCENVDIYHIHKDTDTVCDCLCSLIVNAWQQLQFMKQKPEKQRNPCRASEQRRNSSCFQWEVIVPQSESPHWLTVLPGLHTLHMEGNTAKHTEAIWEMLCVHVFLEAPQVSYRINSLHHEGTPSVVSRIYRSNNV